MNLLKSCQMYINLVLRKNIPSVWKFNKDVSQTLQSIERKVPVRTKVKNLRFLIWGNSVSYHELVFPPYAYSFILICIFNTLDNRWGLGAWLIWYSFLIQIRVLNACCSFLIQMLVVKYVVVKYVVAEIILIVIMYKWFIYHKKKIFLSIRN